MTFLKLKNRWNILNQEYKPTCLELLLNHNELNIDQHFDLYDYGDALIKM